MLCFNGTCCGIHISSNSDVSLRAVRGRKPTHVAGLLGHLEAGAMASVLRLPPIFLDLCGFYLRDISFNNIGVGVFFGHVRRTRCAHFVRFKGMSTSRSRSAQNCD